MKRVLNFLINTVWILGIIVLSATAGHYLTADNPNTASAQSAVTITK